MIGIYKITNLINNKVYIGQSWNIEKRWYAHRSREFNNHLNHSIKKYKINNFSFEVIQELDASIATQELLNSLEQKYIQEFESINPEKGYNKKSGGNQGGHLSQETKNKISATKKLNPRKQTLEEKQRRKQTMIQKYGFPVAPITDDGRKRISLAMQGNTKGSKRKITPELRKKLSIANTGKHHTEESKEKNRQAHLGRCATEETRKKLRDSRRRRQEQGSELYRLNGNASLYFICPYGVFSSIKIATKLLGLSSTNALRRRIRIAPELYFRSKERDSLAELNKVIRPFEHFHGTIGKQLNREWLYIH